MSQLFGAERVHGAGAPENMYGQDRPDALAPGRPLGLKGTVQQWIQLEDNGALKLTIAKWRTPNKNWIHHIGIIPDVAVTTPADASPTARWSSCSSGESSPD